MAPAFSPAGGDFNSGESILTPFFDANITKTAALSSIRF